MTPEELMKPRWKVIADYPSSPFVINQVFTIPNFDKEFTKKYWADDKDKYPHIFQRLQWWEDRTLEEMPGYLNCPSKKMFFKVAHWHKSYFIIDGRQKMQYGNYLPATLEEYEQYINTKEV